MQAALFPLIFSEFLLEFERNIVLLLLVGTNVLGFGFAVDFLAGDVIEIGDFGQLRLQIRELLGGCWHGVNFIQIAVVFFVTGVDDGLLEHLIDFCRFFGGEIQELKVLVVAIDFWDQVLDYMLQLILELLFQNTQIFLEEFQEFDRTGEFLLDI